jgi:hypothetical protein
MKNPIKKLRTGVLIQDVNGALNVVSKYFDPNHYHKMEIEFIKQLQIQKRYESEFLFI